MQLFMRNTTLQLAPRQIVKLRGARGLRIVCQSGQVWLTQEGVARDDFLAGGSACTLETDGTVLIEALRTARVALLPATPVTGAEVEVAQA